MIGWVRGWFGKSSEPSRVAEGVRIYAVGDIHGCLQSLEALLQMIYRDSEGFPGHRYLVFLGDYVDRGPASKGVIERQLLPFAGFETLFIRGNHDQVLLDFLDDPLVFRYWQSFGGRETLTSYGVTPPLFDDEAALVKTRDMFAATIPRDHIQFLQELRFFAQIGDYFFVHAGVRPGIALDKQASHDLMWIREEFLSSRENFGKVIVHGHTPTAAPVRCKNRIGVNTGVYATGVLSAAVLEGVTCRFLTTDSQIREERESGVEFSHLTLD